ncbi:DUF815 domain-containing protein [Deferribacter autotrophicus]|uniref:DUF815 domain-containing protein n=1 Tax=Deferribacter autotrophicus TaxID=500465 RepID=A0A5A8F961_9BACT|nr:DUF815 domain-containing protein [Deferribacter autotrophicus]KAA0259502.1 DUF815 domain-containing protein [Deferribacter autotrophicus]
MENIFKNCPAFRWDGQQLEEIHFIESVRRKDLIGIDNQIHFATKNIESFIEKGISLNMLLWGERGCGKSSLINMLLTEYSERGLRVIEFPQEKIETIFKLFKTLRPFKEFRFILFFDDISFDEQDIYYRKFKSIMEGGLESTPPNVMFVATSNRRHLIEDKTYDSDTPYNRDEINEAMSLYARFGLVIGFYPISRKTYLDICKYYMDKYSIPFFEDWEKEAENFAINRGRRTARVAKQFAIYQKIFR